MATPIVCENSEIHIDVHIISYCHKAWPRHVNTNRVRITEYTTLSYFYPPVRKYSMRRSLLEVAYMSLNLCAIFLRMFIWESNYFLCRSLYFLDLNFLQLIANFSEISIVQILISPEIKESILTDGYDAVKYIRIEIRRYLHLCTQSTSKIFA